MDTARSAYNCHCRFCNYVRLHRQCGDTWEPGRRRSLVDRYAMGFCIAGGYLPGTVIILYLDNMARAFPPQCRIVGPPRYDTGQPVVLFISHQGLLRIARKYKQILAGCSLFRR